MGSYAENKKGNKEMKKLMIVAAVAAMAFGAQANLAKWGVNANDLAYKDGTTAYVMLAAAYNALDFESETLVADIKSAASGANGAAYEVTWNDVSEVYQTGSKTLKSDNVVIGNNTFYAILLNSDESMYFDAGSAVVAGVADNGSPKATTLKIGNAAASSSAWTATSAVPEPTSGLLLLLGVAGLALKRKRA